MKIFERGGKINFVDENNVFVGFDNNQNCCEDFGYSISLDFPKELIRGTRGLNLDGFVFDVNFYERASELNVEGGGTAVFRLTKGFDQAFLLLWNSHNGYYSHGFTMENEGAKIHAGSL